MVRGNVVGLGLLLIVMTAGTALAADAPPEELMLDELVADGGQTASDQNAGAPTLGHANRHEPIHIDDIQDLRRPAEISGVRNPDANGTASDPFIISGWRISPRRPDNKWVCYADGFLGSDDSPAPPIDRADETRLCRPAISIETTDVHIRIEDNRFPPVGGSGSTMAESLLGTAMTSRDVPAISLVDADNVHIVNNHLGDPAGERIGDGIEAVRSDNLRIEANTIQHTEGPAIETDLAQDIAIVDNELRDSSDSYDGIGIDAVDVTGLRIEGNAITGHAIEGIDLLDDFDTKIIGNTVQDNWQSGAQYSDAAIYVAFGVDFYYNDLVGDVTIQGNRILDNGDAYGIYLWDAGGVVTDNDIADREPGALQKGVRFDDRPTDARFNWWGCDDGPSHPGHHDGRTDCQPVTKWDSDHPHHEYRTSPILTTWPDAGADDLPVETIQDRVNETVDDTNRKAQDTADDAQKEAGDAVDRTQQTAEDTVEDVNETQPPSTDDVNGTVEDAGNTTTSTVQETEEDVQQTGDQLDDTLVEMEDTAI